MARFSQEVKVFSKAKLIFFSSWIVLALVLAGCSSATPPPALQPGLTAQLTAGVPSGAPTTAGAGTVEPTATITQAVSALPIIVKQPTVQPTSTPITITFAVIGDFGENSVGEKDVAALVQGWQPDFVITTGDNNYPRGGADTIDQTIGQYYHQFIAPYKGQYGNGAAENRFFPSLGNHDWQAPNAQPYLDYFTLPGNERYYDFTQGPVHFFAIDSDSNEPDGVSSTSIQANWLKAKLTASQSPWNLVYFHHPPYSSGTHQSTEWMRWPFKAWGASAVLSGHDHTYERLLVDNLPYFVDGLGGGPIYAFTTVLPGSQVRYNSDYGALRVQASDRQMIFQFFSRKGELIDTYTLDKSSPAN